MNLGPSKLDHWKTSQQALHDALREAGADILGKAIRCPWKDAHANGDKHASGSTYQTDKGEWRFKCHGCGFNDSIVGVISKAEGLTTEQVIKDHSNAGVLSDANQKPTRVSTESSASHTARFKTAQEAKENFGEKSTVYAYTNPDTKRAEMLVVRTDTPEGKTFLQLKPNGDGFDFGGPAKPWPIYNRTRLAASAEVVVVEGEKSVHALNACGIVATTSPGGALKGEHADWMPLSGKRVTLWPDADPPCATHLQGKGVAHMQQVADILAKLPNPPQVRVVDPFEFDLPEKGDAADMVLNNGDEEDRLRVRQVLDSCAPADAPSAPLANRIEAMIRGEWVSVPWGRFDVLTRLTAALIPGTVTLLCGEPGDGKSFLMLQSVAWWTNQGIPCAYFELEEDLAFHLNRAVAQMSCENGIANPGWVKDHPEQARTIIAIYQPELDVLTGSIWDAPDDHKTSDDVVEWVEARAKEGRRIIVVDPITAADSGDKPWKEDERTAKSLKRIARNYGVSVVLVTHPKGNGGKGGGDIRHMLAGGQAWPRAAQTIVWIKKLDKPKRYQVHNGYGPTVACVNRILKVGKTRNGSGSGSEIAFNFDIQSLTFTECGVIIGDAPEVDEFLESA